MDKKYEDNLNFIGITSTELGEIYSYCVHKIKITDVYKPTMLDIMQKIIRDDQYFKSTIATTNYESELKTIRNLMFKISFFKTYMRDMKLVKQGTINDDHLITMADVATMSDLRIQLDLLKKVKEKIEKQISLTETQMSNIPKAVQIRKERNVILTKK